MADKIKILMYEPYPFGKMTGNIRTQCYIIDLIDRSKFEIILVSPFSSEFTEYAEEHAYKSIVLEPPKRVGQYGQKALKDNFFGKCLTVIDLLKYSYKLYKFIKKEKIDVLYCNGIRSVLTCSFSAIIARVPVLWYIKGELENSLLDKVGFIMANKILFFCEENKHDDYPMFVKLFNRKIEILKIGLDMKTLEGAAKRDHSNLIEELGVRSEDMNLVYLGQLYAPKGVHFLLEALGSLVKDYPELKLYVVGDPILEEYSGYLKELHAIVDKYQMKENVVFTGWRSDALEVVSIMDIVVHPSLHEGFGYAVLEGMALSKMIIASAVGGLREAIRDGENGYLLEPGFSEPIAESLRKVLNDKSIIQRFGKRARETVVSDYLIEDKIVEYQNIVARMAKGS